MLGLRVFLAFCVPLAALGAPAAAVAGDPAPAGAGVSPLSPTSVETAALLQPGTEAPSFRLPDASGREWALEELLDRPVVLYFYPKDDSPGCTREACAFRDDSTAYDSLGIRVVGISTDPPESHRAFAAKHRLSFLLLSDTLGSVVRAYRAEGPLAKARGDGAGVIARRVTYLIGADGVIRRVYPKVDPGTHSAEILAAAAQVFAGEALPRPAGSSDRRERSGR